MKYVINFFVKFFLFPFLSLFFVSFGFGFVMTAGIYVIVWIFIGLSPQELVIRGWIGMSLFFLAIMYIGHIVNIYKIIGQIRRVEGRKLTQFIRLSSEEQKMLVDSASDQLKIGSR